MTETYRGAGINGYILQLLNHLPVVESARPDAGIPLEYIAYLHDRRFQPPPSLRVDRSGWDTRSPWRRILWEQTRLAVASRGLALLHGLAFATPLAVQCPTVVTVHDLSFLRFPGAFRPYNRSYLNLATRLSVRRAARVIAVSESTRQDVISLCGLPPAKVTAVPNGVTQAFSPAPQDQVEAFRRNKGLPDRYILYLGTLEPRKNLVKLVEAYAKVRQMMRRHGGAGGDEAPTLIIAGSKGWYYDEITARVADLALSERVSFPGFVPLDELPWWYRAATLFVYPSIFEGFGLPVLEAMACGTPAVTSTASSLPEVAGDAALLVNPYDTDELAAAIVRVLTDPGEAERLRRAGPRQAARFSWTRTALATAAIYRDVLGLTSRGGAA